MPDLLLELLSEEIPARMQRRAAEDLRTLVTDALVERGFLYEGAKAFATPRRLALHVAGLPAKGKDVVEERRGPRVGAPDPAVQGFLKSAGLASIDEARIESDPKKGEFYVARIERPGRPTPEVLAEIMPGIVKTFPWPKSMRWGSASREPGSLRWVRPLQSIVCTFGPETEIPDVVPFEVDGIRAGDFTRGHRFLAPEPFQVRRYDDYVRALERAKVVLDADRRRDLIRHEAENISFAKGLELVEDEALLEEVAGLVEWPVVLMGAFEEEFLGIPPEVIRATIRANQKCFVLRDAGSSPLVSEGGRDANPAASGEDHPHPQPLPARGRGNAVLSNRFILVSNLEAKDGGRKIVAGNERVVRARLADAKFFWETDQKIRLEDRLEKLKSIVFHEKLGTQYERVERIAALAKELAPVVGAEPELAERAARLAKADLVTEMVGEFPELQGLMGRYYAAAQGEHPSVAAAIEEHYKPLGPTDRVPPDPVSVAVALADKIDTLVGFWAIDEKPTGSKDPYALRRAALGVIRLVLENQLRLPLKTAFRAAIDATIRTDREFYELYDLTVGQGLDFIDPDRPIDTAQRLEPHLRVRPVISRFFSLSRYVGENVTGSVDGSSDCVSAYFDFVHAYLFLNWMIDTLIRDELKYGGSGDELVARVRSEQEQNHQNYNHVDLLSFFADRLKVYLREQGARHDLIDAVFSAVASSPSPLVGEGGRDESAPVGATSSGTKPSGTTPTPSPSPQGGGERAGVVPGEPNASGVPPARRQAPGREGDPSAAARRGSPSPSAPSERPAGDDKSSNDDLLMIVRRVEALGRFLDTEDGKNLLAGYRRAANIVRIEEKKDGRSYDQEPDRHLVHERGLPEEKVLSEVLEAAAAHARDHIAREDFEGAMRALAELRPTVDAFFDKVTVNTDDPALRENRLKLLNQFRRATREVADFSRIEG